VRWGLSVFAL